MFHSSGSLDNFHKNLTTICISNRLMVAVYRNTAQSVWALRLFQDSNILQYIHTISSSAML